jgi:pyruvate,orthophosphate dikinase
VEVVGGKAAHLIRMATAGLPVPPGFVLPTSLCRAYFHQGQRLPADFAELLAAAVRRLGQVTGLSFGGDRRPLLVSVRSGAAVSMPGMMDTILNVGLCGRTLESLVRMTGNPRHAWDCYRRLVQTYGEVVEQLPGDPFERLLGERLRREAVPSVAELDVAALRGLTQEFLDHFEAEAGRPFPQEPQAQLAGAVEAVFRSWASPRAVTYRRLHGLDDLAGTAVTVQAMVYGNLGATSGSGVAFSRDPATGEDRLYLDFLPNAQGEDVVSGRCAVQDSGSLRRVWPVLDRDLRQAARRLELLFRDAQDFEFTVQEGRLYLLQARAAKRTPWAALRTVCELVREGLIDEREALQRLEKYDLAAIQQVRLRSGGGQQPLCAGTAASPGVAVGELVLDPQTAVTLAAEGRTPILVRPDITTEDIAGIAASAGVLTARGGRTSHAAVVARQLNKVCIVGCRDLIVAGDRHGCHLAGRWFAEGEVLSLDGQSGNVYAGPLEVQIHRPSAYLEEVRQWQARATEPGRPLSLRQP